MHSMRSIEKRRTSKCNVPSFIQSLLVRLGGVSHIRALLHLHAVRNNCVVREHNRLRSPSRTTGKQEQRELRPSLSRLKLGLNIAPGLSKSFLHQFADGDMAVTRNGVKEDNTIIANTGFVCCF